MEEKTRGAILHCHANWAEMGDKISKYFFQMEKQNYNRKVINILRKDDRIITEGNQILETLRDFYQELYMSKSDMNAINAQGYLDGIELPTLSVDEKAVLDEPIGYEEIFEVIKSLKNGKTPGTDGLPIELYKHFIHKLSPILLKLCEEIIVTQEFLVTARRGIIALLEKPDKDVMYILNWRPLTLKLQL